jgi:hypothetical protein
MKDTTLSGQLALSRSPLLFDLDTLFVQLQGVKDRRYRRGVRYPLAPTLLIGVLAKLAGAHSSREIAHWASLRAQELSRLLALKREQMPHFSTWSRILGTAVDPKEVEEVLGRFFKQRVKKPVKPGERHLCRDGKTLKGTIALGERQGVHWLAAYLPQEGVVLAPVQVPGAGSEVSAAPVLLATLDLRGMVVSGDALFASRKLSLSILHKKGDYLWMVKENRKQMYQEIQTLFEPQPSRPGWSAPSMDFRSASFRETRGMGGWKNGASPSAASFRAIRSGLASPKSSNTNGREPRHSESLSGRCTMA